MIYYIALFVGLASANTCPGLISKVQDCGQYTGTKECTGKGKGCVGAGWFSKDNTVDPFQRINAHDVCKQQGYSDGADLTNFGGNWGHQCRFPGDNTPNKAGGALTALGYTVTWKCAGSKRSCPVTTTPKPTSQFAGCGKVALPTNVVRCSTYNGAECTGKGAGCVKGAGWFSKDNVSNPNQRVNAQQICKDQGYTGADTTRFGGNWAHQCRHPGASINAHNKAGGALTALGYTVTWKCTGTCQKQDDGCTKSVLPAPVKRCSEYTVGTSPECKGKGAGCVTGSGWFSKDNTVNPFQRVNADAVCKAEGYAEGADVVMFGGNWGHQCRHPGSTVNQYNKAGGSLTNLGYTVTWKCKGKCGPVPTSKPTTDEPSPAPTMPPPTQFPTTAKCYPVQGKGNPLNKPKKSGKKKFPLITANACDCWDFCVGNNSESNLYSFKAPSQKIKKGVVSKKVKKGKCVCYISGELSSVKGSYSDKRWTGGPRVEDWCKKSVANVAECSKK